MVILILTLIAYSTFFVWKSFCLENIYRYFGTFDAFMNRPRRSKWGPICRKWCVPSETKWSESVGIDENAVYEYGVQFRLAVGKSVESDSENCKAPICSCSQQSAWHNWHYRNVIVSSMARLLLTASSIAFLFCI